MLDKILQLQAALREVMTGESFADAAVRGVCSDIENACTELAQAVLDGLKAINQVAPENDAQENRLMKADDLISEFVREARPQLERAGGRACATCYHGNLFDASVACVLTNKTRHMLHCAVCDEWESRCEGGYRKPAVKA
jgi:hypothetical protein